MPQTYINMTGIGTGGMNTDSPPWAIRPQQAQDMTDVVVFEGVATQRRGWANYLPVTPGNLIGGVGSYFIAPLGGAIVTVIDRAKTLYAHSTEFTSGTWQPIIGTGGLNPTPQYVPRAQYQDEILLCDQTGTYPMLRTMGRTTDALVGLGLSVGAHTAVVTVGGSGGLSVSGMGLVGPSTVPQAVTEAGGGSYMHPVIGGDSPSFRIVKRASSNYTLRNIDFAAAASAVGSSGSILMYGTTWPNVEVYSDGLASWPNGSTTVTVEGGGLMNAPWGKVFARTGADALVPLSDSIRAVVEWDEFGLPSKWQSRLITASTDPSLTAISAFSNLPSGKKAPYSIMRRSPFREVEVHQECLWGAGVEQHPSRVYYSPRGWDMQTPPELAQPWNGITDFYSPTEGMMRYTDIEGAGDGDKVMALLSSDGPLLIITQRACYGAYGTWPSFRREMVAAGAGCIDTRSAVGVAAYGQFWAGPDGIYGYRRGRVTDLTSERINELWRATMRKYDSSTGSYVACGITNGHLIVAARTTRGTTQNMTLGLNIATGAWTRLSNMSATAMQNPAIWSEKETLIAALEGSAQLVDFLPAFDMTGTPADADGDQPAMRIVTGVADINGGDPDGESRLVEVRVGGIVDDSAPSSPPSSLTVQVQSQGAIAQANTTSTTTGVLAGQNNGLIRRERIRVGNAGRTHQVTIQSAATSPNNRQISIAEIGLNARKRRIPR